MNTQTEAQRLAEDMDELDTDVVIRLEGHDTLLNSVAEELRRLEAANAELLEALRHIEGATMDITCDRRSIREAARAAIAKHGGAA